MSRIVRRVKQAGVYFVTTDTWQRRQLFLKPELAAILMDQLQDCRSREFFKLHAFAIMPDHLHLLMTPGEDKSLGKAVQMIKGGSSFRIRKTMNNSFPIWHQSFHDRWIRDREEYFSTKDYINQNPVKNRLVDKIGDYP